MMNWQEREKRQTTTLVEEETMRKKCNKWTVLVFYFLLFQDSIGAPEKLTQEEVLKELGVKIETKGKRIFFLEIVDLLSKQA